MLVLLQFSSSACFPYWSRFLFTARIRARLLVPLQKSRSACFLLLEPVRFHGPDSRSLASAAAEVSFSLFSPTGAGSFSRPGFALAANDENKDRDLHTMLHVLLLEQVNARAPNRQLRLHSCQQVCHSCAC